MRDRDNECTGDQHCQHVCPEVAPLPPTAEQTSIARFNALADQKYEGVAPSSFATYRSCAKQLDAAKLRIEEAVKALLENSNAPANNTYYSRFRDGQRVTCEAVLKIIREIL